MRHRSLLFSFQGGLRWSTGQDRGSGRGPILDALLADHLVVVPGRFGTRDIKAARLSLKFCARDPWRQRPHRRPKRCPTPALPGAARVQPAIAGGSRANGQQGRLGGGQRVRRLRLNRSRDPGPHAPCDPSRAYPDGLADCAASFRISIVSARGREDRLPVRAGKVLFSNPRAEPVHVPKLRQEACRPIVERECPNATIAAEFNVLINRT